MRTYEKWLQPKMDDQYNLLRSKVQERIQSTTGESDQEIRRMIADVIREENFGNYISVQESIQYGKQIFNCIRGLDILQPLLEDEEITEIMVNGPEHIFVEKAGKLIRTPLHFESRTRLDDLIQQIVGKVNRQVNELNPIADARLEDGSRVNVILPPVALNGPIVSIRKFRKVPITVEEMIQWGTLTEESAEFLRQLVIHRYNLFVCGGTGSGKTTLLNVLSNFISQGERIITIEDAAELRLSSLENVVTLETRNGSEESHGQVSMRQLIKTSLRARPDRIIVGEVRGGEALDMLSAMNTGHDGSLSTGHANSTRDMISRIATMVLMGADLPMEAIERQIASAIDIFIYIARGKDRVRKVTEISQVCGIEAGEVRLEPLFAMENGKLVRTDFPLRRLKGDMEAEA